MKYPNIHEKELKNKVGANFFSAFNATNIIGNIDFCAAIRHTKPSQLPFLIPGAHYSSIIISINLKP